MIGDNVPYVLKAVGLEGDVLDNPQTVTNDDYP